MYSKIFSKRYLLLAAVLLLIIGGIYFFYSRNTLDNTLNIINDPKILEEQKILIQKTQESFRGESNLGLPNMGFSFSVGLTAQELAAVSKDSFVFKIAPLSSEAVKGILKAKTIDYETDDRIQFTTGGTPEAFMSSYTTYLNSKLPTNIAVPVTFSFRKLSERPLLKEGDEYRSRIFPEEAATHREYLYNIYLNSNLVTMYSGFNTIQILKPLKDTTDLIIRVPYFFPSEITVQSKVDYSETTIKMKPAVSNDPKFTNVLLEEGLQFKQSDFVVSKIPAEKVYVYNPEGILAPLISKKVSFPKINSLKGVTYYISSY